MQGARNSIPMKTISLLAAVCTLPFAAANAADEPAKPKRDPAQIFKAIDRDGNGSIDLEEYKISTVGHIDPARVGDVFKKKDADGDGKLSLSEYMYVPPQEPAKPAEDAKKAK
jgi:EF-hand domain pair